MTRAERGVRITAKPAQARAKLKTQLGENEVLGGIELNTAGIRGVWKSVGTCAKQLGYTETSRLRLVGFPVHKLP